MMKEVRTYVKKVLSQMMVWCDRQDRSSFEVKQKLGDKDLDSEEIEWVMTQLQEGDYQNDARFADSFVSGHFRIKKWGKLKIRNGLKTKGVSSELAKQALASIDPDQYEEHLSSYLRSKGWKKGEDFPFKEKQRLLRSAYQRGYEPDLIRTLID